VTTKTGDQTVSLRDPYPFFAQKRRDSSGAFAGTVMDYSKTPDSLVPKREYTAVSFHAVNTVFRNGGVFSSAPYDNTIGLFMGPTILAMDGKKHREHRNLVSAAFRSKSLAQWEPTIVRPICNALIDEFIDTGQADLVRNFTFEFPTRVIARLLGLPDEDLPMFRRRAVELISYTVNYERAFEASAALKDYFSEQIDKRRAKPTEDIIGDLVTAEIDGEKLSDEAIYSFASAAARRVGNHLPLLWKPALPPAVPPRPIRRGPTRRRAGPPGDRRGVALRDAADHCATVHHRRR
jgi:cytochrome P450